MDKPSDTLEKTARTAVRRRPARASYDRGLAYTILDEAPTCAVGFVDEGHPFVLPMAFARWNDRILLHGARAGRLLGRVRESSICVTVTIVDGLVLARSAMHHSMNYRSVAVLGQAVEIVDRAEEALHRIVDHVLPGRSSATRSPSDAELAATMVLGLPIREASVKVRSGGPVDDDADLALPYWAGVVPLKVVAAGPVADPLHPPAGLPPKPSQLKQKAGT